MGIVSRLIPTLLDCAIWWRLHAKPSLESMELVAAWLLARVIPSVSRAFGRRTALTRDGYFAESFFSFDSRILRPALGFPKGPVTAIMSPGRAPFLRTIVFRLANPMPAMSITRSSDWLVSPPMILHLYSRAAWPRPRAMSWTVFFLTGAGSPRETIRACGLTPFAAKSLTVATTAFLAAS